jgi:hypothetical protein
VVAACFMAVLVRSSHCRCSHALLRSSGCEGGEQKLAREQRRLATVAAADAVGRARLMGRAEAVPGVHLGSVG